MVYIVLGMHKSGTTLISQILHQSGINMVDDLDANMSYDRGNKHERESTKAINHEILESAGVFSLEIDLHKEVQCNPEQSAKIREIIRDCSLKYQQWGFKDPRTCLTYPIWASEMPEHEIIVIYRSPSEVWSRYHKSRQQYRSTRGYLLGAWQFIENWCRYNENIIGYLKSSKVPFLVLDYSKFMTQDTEFDRLQCFVERSLVDCRDQNLYRSQSTVASKALLAALCWLKTFKRPHDICQQLEDLGQRSASKSLSKV
jgi:hypothetical protein